MTSDATYKHLNVTTEGGVRTIVLNRDGSGEKRNALTEEMIGEISRAFTQAQSDEGVKAVVLRGKEKEGKGGAFCGGFDLAWLQEIMREPERANRARRLMPLVQLLDQLDRFDKPMIGVADGAAVGAGATLLELCDHVIATPDVKIGYPEVKMGLMPSLSAIYALRRMGSARAESLFSSGKIYNARDSADQWHIKSCGLVDTMLTTDSAPAINDAVATALSQAPEAPSNFVSHSPKHKEVIRTNFPEDDSPQGKMGALLNEVTKLYQDRSSPVRRQLMDFTAGHLAAEMDYALPKLDTYLASLAQRSTQTAIKIG